jgi:hypothetical protein
MPNWSIGFDAQSANVRSQAFDASQSAASAPDCRQSIVANVRIGKHSCLACVEDARLRRFSAEQFTRLDADQTGTALSCPTIVRHSDPLIKRRIEQNLARIGAECRIIRDNGKLSGHVPLQPLRICNILRTRHFY